MNRIYLSDDMMLLKFVFVCYDCVTEDGFKVFKRKDAIKHVFDTNHNVRMEAKE